MPRSRSITDNSIIERLREAGEPLTAAALGVPVARLHVMEGVVVAGNVKTGQRGRPRLLFALKD